MIGRDDYRQLTRSILKVTDSMSDKEIDLLISSIRVQRFKKFISMRSIDPGDDQEFCDNQEKKHAL